MLSNGFCDIFLEKFVLENMLMGIVYVNFIREYIKKTSFWMIIDLIYCLDKFTVSRLRTWSKVCELSKIFK